MESGVHSSVSRCTLTLIVLLLALAGPASGGTVVEELRGSIDLDVLDMAAVRPAQVRIGERARERSTVAASDDANLKKLASRSRPRGPARYLPAFSGQRHPAGLSVQRLPSSAPLAAGQPTELSANETREWVRPDDRVSGAAFNALGQFPFNASRVDMYGDNASSRFPYRTIGVVIVGVDDEFFSCTASLIAPLVVLTAAHCVSEFGGDLVDSAIFIPAYNQGLAPYGVWVVQTVARTDAFIDGTSTCRTDDGVACDDDFATLSIASKVDARGREFTLGEKIGWLGVGIELYGFDGFFSDPVAQLSQFGYPGTHDGAEMMQRADKGATYEEEDNIIVSSSPFGTGSSGGPHIANFGEPAVLLDDFDAGLDADANIVTAVTTAGNSFFSDDFAAYLDEENFLELFNRTCSGNALRCATEFEDPIASRDMLLSIEEPANGGVYSGVGNLRGWAVYEFGVESIEIYIDGDFQFEAPYGGERNDVGNNFPDIPNANLSGYSLAFGYLNLEPGEHQLEVIARSSTGDFTSRRSTFTVTGFDTPFVTADDEVDVTDASVMLDGDSMALDGVVIDGETYNIELQWDTASQGFDLRAIEKTSE